MKFKRILLKLSGEALAGEKGHGIDNQILSDMASEIASIVKQGVQVALVIGGGNLVRGISASAGGMNRAQGDAMGMLGTVMNGLAMQDALDKQGIDSVVMSAIRMEPVCEFFDRRKALKLLSAGSVVIFSVLYDGQLRRPSRHRKRMRRHHEGHQGGWHLHRRPGQGPDGHPL